MSDTQRKIDDAINSEEPINTPKYITIFAVKYAFKRLCEQEGVNNSTNIIHFLSTIPISPELVKELGAVDSKRLNVTQITLEQAFKYLDYLIEFFKGEDDEGNNFPSYSTWFSVFNSRGAAVSFVKRLKHQIQLDLFPNHEA
jgi:hypothetical protein